MLIFLKEHMIEVKSMLRLLNQELRKLKIIWNKNGVLKV